MAEKGSKKKSKQGDGRKPPPDASLDQLVLDKKSGKYGLVSLITYWARELRKREEHRHLTQNEILELAMKEVLAGKVSEKDLLSKMLAGESANGGGHAAKKAEADKAKKKDG